MKFVMFMDGETGIRWKLLGPDDQLMAISTEVFSTVQECFAVVTEIRNNCKSSKVEDKTAVHAQ